MSEQIRQKLNELSDLQLGQTAINLRKQEEIDQVITAEIKAKLAEIDAKYLGQTSDLQARITDLDKWIREEAMKFGASIKGSRLHAVWMKGRVSWDTRALDGYAAGHPEIAGFRKEGQPTISIRPVVDQKTKPTSYDPVEQAEYMRKSAGV
jgi:hypothetical protein